MKMVSMARTPEKAKEEDCCCCPSDDSKYPYGLQLSMEEEQLTALGVTEMPKVGTEMTMTVKCKVTSCSERETDEGTERCLSMQITEIGSMAPDKGMFDHPSRVRGE